MGLRAGLRIGFMGTPDFAREALAALCESDHEIVCVYSQPPRPKGRGHKVQNSPVHEFALEHDIPVFHPENLKSKDVQAEFASHNLDVAVVAAYGLILPQVVLDTPKYGCLNIHASLLPRWRGASPIQHAIWKGDSETGITIMQMDAGLDTGPMVEKEAVFLSDQSTAASLHDALAALGGRMIVDVLDHLARDKKLSSEPQNNDESNYAPLLKKSNGAIDWNDSAADIDRQIRALNPWPGTSGMLGDKRFKITNATLRPETIEAAPGRILNKNGDISCGGGSVLRLLTIQPEGKKAMDFASALNGGYVEVEMV